MTTLNYQSPQDLSPDGVWASKNLVMARDGASLPPRCMKCNTADNLKWKWRSLTWAPPYLYFVLLVGLIPAIIVLMIFQKKAKIQTASCAICSGKLLKRRLIAWGIFLSSGLFIALAIAFEKPEFLIPIPFLIIGSMIYAIVACRSLTIVKIKDGVTTIRGLSPSFIASLNQA